MEVDSHDGQRRTLARCSMCEVEHCADCDVVHVHVGHASLRLTTSGFMTLCATLLEAARLVGEQPDVRCQPATATPGLQ